jgi:hypothetical protein
MSAAWRFVKVWATPLAIFFLPWQTKLILESASIASQPSPYGELSLYAIFVLILLATIVQIKEILRLPKSVTVSGGVFILALVLSSAFGAFAPGWFVYLGFSALLLLAVASYKGDAARLRYAFAAGLIGPFIVGIAQIVFGSSPASTVLGLAPRSAEALGDSIFTFGGERMLRSYGSLPHPNIFGGYLAVALIILAPFKTWWQRVGAGSAVLGLLLTFSQSAWIGAALGILTLLIVKRSKVQHIIKKHGSKLSLAAGIAVTAVLAALFVNTNFTSESLADRAAQYEVYTDLVRPPLTGLGPAQFAQRWSEVQPALDWWKYQPIHNVPLLIFAEIGAIGLLALLWFLYEIDQLNYARLKKREAQIALAAGTTLVAIAFFDHYLWTLWPGLALAAFVLGLTMKSGIRS